jgi:O-antigen chain-terminating methyltransferase
MLRDSFYLALEDRFRGPRESIKSRFKVYLPFIEPLEKVYEKSDVKGIDLGCGRGEWLELLGENGFFIYGVDLSEDVLQTCRQCNLNVTQADALEYLTSQQDESFILVTGFHIAEHLPFEKLRKLISESLRVLKPGGLLILESPNPENIVVGTANFYFDPTHQKPLPPLLLSFVVEYAGFFRVKTLRLQEPKGILDSEDPSLFDVLDGVSPDYSIVAQKEATEQIMSYFDSVFEQQYGVDLYKSALHYDQSLKSKLNDLTQANKDVFGENVRLTCLMEQLTQIQALQIDQLQVLQSVLAERNAACRALEGALAAERVKRETLETQVLRVAELECLGQEQLGEISHLREMQNALDKTLAELEDALAAERVQQKNLIHEIGELRASHSWRYTGPLRFVSRTAGYMVYGAIAWLTLAPSSRPRRMLRAFVVRVGNWAWRHPRYADKLNSSLRRFPALHRRLKSAIRGNIAIEKSEFSVPKLDDMPPHVRHIYSVLKEKQNITH